MILQELRRLGWQETDLMSRRRHDPGKVQIAVRLRRETTLSVKQIAQRLHFGTPKSASFRLLTVMRTQTYTAHRSVGSIYESERNGEK